jgi:hypothetical protein
MRVRHFPITCEALAIIFATGAEHNIRVACGFPDDAVVRGAFTENNHVVFVVESREFNEVPFSQAPPERSILLEDRKLRVLKAAGAIVLVLTLAAGLRAQTIGYRMEKLGAVEALVPDPVLTPGAVRPDATTKSVCHGGSTAQFRKTTESMKANAYATYGVKPRKNVCCEVDHLISLELGGADDPRNLWPQPYEPRPGAHEKDLVEDYLHRQVCAGAMSLADAQHQIATDWLAVYLKISSGKHPQGEKHK